MCLVGLACARVDVYISVVTHTRLSVSLCVCVCALHVILDSDSSGMMIGSRGTLSFKATHINGLASACAGIQIIKKHHMTAWWMAVTGASQLEAADSTKTSRVLTSCTCVQASMTSRGTGKGKGMGKDWCCCQDLDRWAAFSSLCRALGPELDVLRCIKTCAPLPLPDMFTGRFGCEQVQSLRL